MRCLSPLPGFPLDGWKVRERGAGVKAGVSVSARFAMLIGWRASIVRAAPQMTLRHTLVTLTTCLLLITMPVAADDGYEQAIAHMGRNPAAADAATREPATALARLDRLLFLHAFRPQAKAEMEGLVRDLTATLAGQSDPYMERVLGAPVPYDGTDGSLVALLRLLSSTGIVQTQSAFYAIPCDVLRRRPGLLAATEPQFGSNRDNFLPRSGCDWGRGRVEGFPDGPIQDFMQAATQADGDFLANHGGSLRFALAAGQAATLQYARLDPTRMPPAPRHGLPPYQIWSYLSAGNREVFARLLPLYKTVLAALTDYYRPLQGDKAAMLARNALFALVWGADCGGAPPPANHVRTLLINGAPLDRVRAALARPDDGPDAFSRCAATAGIDPLSHLAAALRPDLLADIVAVEGVDARNSFGKTPLMAAAQADQLGAASWLLAHSADVRAATGETDEFTFPKHGQRTALHYAAANASLPVIEALLAAGADPAAKDDEGVTPLDYLNGKGPVPANPRLSGAELDRARALLSKP